MTLNQPISEPKVTPDELDPAVRFADDPVTARGTMRVKPKPADKEEVERRINFARTRMQAGKSDGDIKRAMFRAFNISPRGAEKYITVARNRIKSYLAVNPETSAAAALDYYSDQVLTFEVPVQRAMAQLQDAHKRLDNVNRFIGDPARTREERASAEDAKKAIEAEIDDLWLRIKQFRGMTEHARQMIVKLTGAAAPTKVALTTAGGEDVLRAAEPATPAAATAEILAIMAEVGLGLTVEASAGTVDSPSPGATERTSED